MTYEAVLAFRGDAEVSPCVGRLVLVVHGHE